MSSASLTSTVLRFLGKARDQLPLSKAVRAAVTARSTSSLSHSATVVSNLPLIGLTLSKVLPEAAGTYLPPMKAWLR